MNSPLVTSNNSSPKILKGSKVVIISAPEDKKAAQDFLGNFVRYNAEGKLFDDVIPGNDWKKQSLQNISDADIVIFFMSSNLSAIIDEFSLTENTSIFNGKYVYNVVHRTTGDYNLIFSEFLKIEYEDLGSAKNEEEIQGIFPKLINKLSEKGFVPGRHKNELLVGMNTTGATGPVAAADIKETIQQPKRMKYKKPIETFAYKVLKNYTMVMPTITIRELDIGNEEFEEFSKHFSSFIGIKLEIKGDIIFVKELEEQLFYSNENYTNYRGDFFKKNNIISLRNTYIMNITGLFSGIEHALSNEIVKEIDYSTLRFLNSYLQSQGAALVFKDGVELKAGEKREGVLKVIPATRDSRNVLPDFYNDYLKINLPDAYSAVIKLIPKIISYKQDVVAHEQVDLFEAPKQSLYPEYFKNLLDPIVNVLLSPNVHGSDETELKYSDFKLLDSDYVLFEEYIGKRTSCNIKVSMSGYGDNKKIKIKLVKFSLGYMTSGQGDGMMDKLGIIRNSLLQVPRNALKNFATEEIKLCNLSQAHFLLLQEFLLLQGIEIKKQNGSLWLNYKVEFHECEPEKMDEGLFLQGLYNNLERSHDCDVPNILDSWRQSIRENTLLQKSIESTTSVFSDSAIKELDREAESKVTVICIDAEMIADLGFVYLLKEINKRCGMGERIFLVQTEDMNLDFMKGYPKIPKLNLHNSSPFEISSKIRSGGIPESSGNLSMIYMNDLGGKINGSTSDTLWKQLRSLKNIKRYAISLKQFKENQLELINN